MVSSQEISAHKTTETDSKRCSIHARQVCAAVILPQRYTKSEKTTWSMGINPVCCIQTQHNKKKTNMEQYMYWSVLMLVNKNTLFVHVVVADSDVIIVSQNIRIGCTHENAKLTFSDLSTFQIIAVSGSQNKDKGQNTNMIKHFYIYS